MITPSFGLTATERVLPRLALDFTTASLDSRVTFARTTSASNPATYVNSSGVITAAANDAPRFDYDPITLACKGLLIEESRTNQILRSEFFSSSTPTYWGRVGVTAPYGITTAPDGSNNASEIIGNGTSTNGYLYNTVQYNTSASQIFTVSGFFKYNTRRYVQIEGGTSVNGFGVTVDLQNGVITATGAQGTGVYQSSSITSFGNGWHRITVTGHCGATTNAGYWDMFLTDSSTYVSGVPTITASSASFYLWGAQLELGAFATSYIGPTTGAALTRNADVAVMTGTNFSDWFNASEGGIVVQGIPKATSGIKPVIQFDDATASEIIALRGDVVDPQLYVVDSGVAQATLDAGTITVNSVFKLAGAWKSASFAAAINGGAAVSQSSGAYPTVTQSRLGSDGTNYLNGWLQNFRYWPQRIINAEVQAFSK